MNDRNLAVATCFAAVFATVACGSSDESGGGASGIDPDGAEVVSVDRFSGPNAALYQRDANADLPGPNEPIDFSTGPFITRGLGPEGGVVRYYNFDERSLVPGVIYELVDGSGQPVPEQLPVIDSVPADDGYNDLRHIVRVTVPADYVANTLVSAADVESSGYELTATERIANVPVVPAGSSAPVRVGDQTDGTKRGWYDGRVAHYLEFESSLEALINPQGEPRVPVSYIWVTFNINPGEDGGGPPSGFVTEPGSDQTHNVVETLLGDAEYSPLWQVMIYDNAYFDQVSDKASAEAAPRPPGAPVPFVNCPLAEQPE